MGGCSIDFNRMDRVLGLSKADHDITVQPGLGEKGLYIFNTMLILTQFLYCCLNILREGIIKDF